VRSRTVRQLHRPRRRHICRSGAVATRPPFALHHRTVSGDAVRVRRCLPRAGVVWTPDEESRPGPLRTGSATRSSGRPFSGFDPASTARKASHENDRIPTSAAGCAHRTADRARSIIVRRSDSRRLSLVSKSRGSKRSARRPSASSSGGELENWFLTAPENQVGVRGGHAGLFPNLRGRWPQTSSLRWLGLGIFVVLGRRKLKGRRPPR
jgi:hypothetical protein